MRRALIWTGRICVAVLALAASIGLGGWAWLSTGLPQTEGEIALPGLERSVEVVRDADGVPHIFAETLDDATFALGFVHAQDRLFQMDFQRRLAAGRLAEVVGAIALPSDRIMRALGVYALAEQTLASAPLDMKRRIDAYSRGVNAYLDSRRGALPPEYYALKLLALATDPFAAPVVDPEPWRGADSLVWGRLMALTLSGNSRGEALRARLSQRLSATQLADLFAEETTGAVTLPAPSDQIRVETQPLTNAPPLQLADSAERDRLYDAFLRAWPASLGPSTASNAWVIDGARTASGKPILANDPHLGFSAPSVWYLARLTTPQGQLIGATVPGVPFAILGHNGQVAWGMTTTTADTQDLFVETLLEGDRYQTPDGPAALVVRQETIKVVGGDPVTLTVRATRHGPLISDVDPNSAAATKAGSALALASTALRPDDRSMEAVWRVGLSRDVDEVRAALALADAPMQNVFFADVRGGAEMMAAAKVPIRRSGDGFMPSPGSAGAHDWTGWIPTEMLPWGAPRVGGYLVNANNRVVGPGYPYFIGRDWEASYRADRIDGLLAGKSGDTTATSGALQLDAFSGMADRLLPLLLADLGASPRVLEARTMLEKWDRRMDRNRPEPLIFAAWLRALGAALIGPAVGDALPMIGGARAPLIERAFSAGGPWCAQMPGVGARLCRDLAESTLAIAIDQLTARYGKEMTSWRWGAAHQARHAHLLFGRLPLLRDWFDIVFPSDGGDDTINRGAMARAGAGDDADSFNHVHGSGYRAVYDLNDLGASRLIIATGQSGHPMSPHYQDFTRRWRDGESRTLNGTKAELASQNGKTLRLSPLQ